MNSIGQIDVDKKGGIKIFVHYVYINTVSLIK